MRHSKAICVKNKLDKKTILSYKSNDLATSGSTRTWGAIKLGFMLVVLELPNKFPKDLCED